MWWGFCSLWPSFNIACTLVDRWPVASICHRNREKVFLFSLQQPTLHFWRPMPEDLFLPFSVVGWAAPKYWIAVQMMQQAGSEPPWEPGGGGTSWWLSSRKSSRANLVAVVQGGTALKKAWKRLWLFNTWRGKERGNVLLPLRRKGMWWQPLGKSPESNQSLKEGLQQTLLLTCC